MKIYSIIKNNSILCVTEDKKLMKKFIEERDLKDYSIKKIKIEKLDSTLFNKIKKKRITYNKFYDMILNEEEISIAKNNCLMKFFNLRRVMYELNYLLTYMKFDDDEKKIIDCFYKIMEDIHMDLTHEESSASVDDYYDVKKEIKSIIKKGGYIK